MTEFQVIGSADYVIAGYVEASDELAAYARTGERSAVRRAAAALCGALVRLAEQDTFWAELGDAFRVPSVRGHQAFRDVEALLDVEIQVLHEAGLTKEDATRIADEAVTALTEYERWPDDLAAERVREAISAAASAACVEASFRKAREPNRSIERALRGAAGAVVIIADAKYAPAGVKELLDLRGRSFD